jgi:hypothetical protein
MLFRLDGTNLKVFDAIGNQPWARGQSQVKEVLRVCGRRGPAKGLAQKV